MDQVAHLLVRGLPQRLVNLLDAAIAKLVPGTRHVAKCHSLAKGLLKTYQQASLPAMGARTTKIRLVGFKGFEASDRFLHGLEQEIWVSRWGRYPRLLPYRPVDIRSPAMLRTELAKPSMVTVISAHAGRYPDGGLYFSGEEREQILAVDSLARPGGLGAASMVLVDACWFEALGTALEPCAQPGSLLVGVKTQDRETHGHDSVSVLGAVVRELCYLRDGDLSPAAIRHAISSVNAQTEARNRAEHARIRGTRKKPQLRPLIGWYPC